MPAHRQLEELDKSKADHNTLRTALDEKADKELVARETEANQRVVDEALRTMNAGTQGIQQLLERQVRVCVPNPPRCAWF
jgi:hypothetical protein